jgi:hypothetical protein
VSPYFVPFRRNRGSWYSIWWYCLTVSAFASNSPSQPSCVHCHVSQTEIKTNSSDLLASVKVQTGALNATIASGEATAATISPALNSITSLLTSAISSVTLLTASALLKRQTSTLDSLAAIVAQLLEELSATLGQLTGLNLLPVLQGSLGPLGIALQTVPLYLGAY